MESFERDFPSLCFALATGVGKTRLMGAFVAYLHIAHGLNNFFVLAPSLTIYNKLVADFTQNTPKYVLKGISQFAVAPPVITTGETYERQIASGGNLFPTTINIFNISKINSEVRGGRSPRIRSFREEIGESYFDYLARLDDLVLIMDESHRYRATAGLRAINELKPVLGLELTATPFVETARGAIPFRNVIFDYPLASAMADGFVKEPAVVTRENFSPVGKSPEAIEQIKLEDGIRLHESVKVELETYARQTGRAIVKPFMLIIARDTTHAAHLAEMLKTLFDGRYADKVIQVDSSVREEETVSRLLKVESADEPTEIVIHVNMLKEGWDVANLYTIVPLRAANARTLIEQSIGRGLRLPYGKRTGVTAVDRLNIVAHDRFQEILEEARRPDSAIRLREVVLSGGELERPLATMVSRPRLMDMLGVASESGLREEAAVFQPEDQPIAALAHEAILQLERRASGLPSIAHLQTPDVQAAIRREVEARYRPQMELDGMASQPDIAAIVARTAELVVRQTIDIPTIQVFPRGAVRSGFRPFTLDLAGLRYEPPSETLWIEHLRTGRIEKVGVRAADHDEISLEDYVVNGLAGIDDVSYDDNADLLYELAGQVVRRLLAYLPESEARKVLRFHQPEIARFVHAQMTAHYWQEADAGYRTILKRQTKGLISRVYNGEKNAPRADFRSPPPDRSHMARYVFAGFARCLYATEKFQSDAERKLAVILDRDSLKWFKPASGQFDLTYRLGAEEREYQPDFVAEMPDAILIMEPKAANQLADREVLAKRDVAAEFCRQATLHNADHGGKPWSYLLIPHDAIAGNMTVANLAQLYAVGRDRR